MASTALITGANRGIGRVIALRLAEQGYNLFLMARNADALAEVVAECQERGVAAASLAGELADEAYMDRAVQAATEAHGGIDVLVNNAGLAVQQAVQHADLMAWRDVMEVNFHAVLYLSRQVLPAMIERKAGAVINISSISGRNTDAGSAIYSASKHALNALTGCMFEDVREHGVKVSTIMPGFVDTDLTSGLGMATDNMIRAEDVADCVAFVLAASSNCCPTEIVLRPQRRP